MKYINIFLVAICFFIMSCDDTLTVFPETSLSVPTFFKTEADLVQAVNGAYAPLRDLNNQGGGGAWVLSEMHSDNAFFARNPLFGARENFHDVAQHAVPTANGVTTNSHVRNLYVTCYQIIARTNQIIFSIDDADVEASAKDNLNGQAHFLRAFAYFELVKYFGKAPLHLTPVTSREEASLPLSETDELYTQIEADAQIAIDLLPPKSEQELGRATSGAARMLLADAHMMQQEWSAAEPLLLNIVNSGEYDLMPTYAEAFSNNASNKNNLESVFEIQYKEGADGLAGGFLYSMIPRPATEAEVASITGTSNAQSLNGEGNNIPTPDLIAAYEPNDARLDATIGYITLSGGFWRDGTYPYCLKYARQHSNNGNHGMSWPVYRYAEVLLSLAEVLDAQGKPGADTYLLMVRNRAELGPYTGDLTDAILRERRVELAFENKRWFDLIRNGTAVSVMTAFGENLKADPEQYYFPNGQDFYPQGYIDVTTTYGLPASESDLSAFF